MGTVILTETTPFVIRERFRGFLPVIVDVETGGFNAATDALLEVAATLIQIDDRGDLTPVETVSFNVEPFEGANIEASALEFTGIDPENPLRGALPEAIALGPPSASPSLPMASELRTFTSRVMRANSSGSAHLST